MCVCVAGGRGEYKIGNPWALPRALTHPLIEIVRFVQFMVLSGQTWYVVVLPRDSGWGWSTAAVPIK